MRPTTLTRLLRPLAPLPASWSRPTPASLPFSRFSQFSTTSQLHVAPPSNSPLGSKTQALDHNLQVGVDKGSTGARGIGTQEGGGWNTGATGPQTAGTSTIEPLSIPIPREAEEPKKSLSESYKSLPSRTRTAFWVMFGLFALAGQQLLDVYVESQGGKGEVEVIDEGEAVVLRIKEGKKPEAEHH